MVKSSFQHPNTLISNPISFGLVSTICGCLLMNYHGDHNLIKDRGMDEGISLIHYKTYRFASCSFREYISCFNYNTLLLHFNRFIELKLKAFNDVSYLVISCCKTPSLETKPHAVFSLKRTVRTNAAVACCIDLMQSDSIGQYLTAVSDINTKVSKFH